ncbi:hypothetical protein [Kribbella sp. NBC_00359]|uniref:hypothetical protein n=1 Tax=Kribbella sp. NBC_00359 TaxID=2975966 RepID=UPI003FA5CFD3
MSVGADVEAEAAAALYPVAMLFGQHDAGEPDQDIAVGEEVDQRELPPSPMLPDEPSDPRRSLP